MRLHRCGRGNRWRRRRGGCRVRGPRSIFLTICGSAIWARVMPTMSSLPSAMAWRAVATSLMRAAWKTGNFVAARTSPAKSRCGEAFMPDDRNDIGERRVVLDVALDDVEEVDEARVLQLVADVDAIGLAEALVPVLVGDQPASDEEVGTDRLAHGFEDAEGEAQAVVERAVIFVGARCWWRATRSCPSGGRSIRTRSHRGRLPSCARRRRHSP